jgi:hypothetical protein
MIPGNRSLRKTCSIASADQASARRHLAGAGHVGPALSRPARRLCYRQAHLAVAGLLRQHGRAAGREAAPRRPRSRVLDTSAVKPDVAPGPGAGKSRCGWPARPDSALSCGMRPASACSASSVFRRSATAASAVGPPPTARTPDTVGERRSRRRPRPVLRRKAYGLCGSLPILRHRERGAGQCAGRSRPAPNNRRSAVASWASRQRGQPDRLGEHEMPTPFSTTRRRAAAESGPLLRVPGSFV